MNRIEITGRLTADPEVFYADTGACRVKFRVAENYYDKKSKENKARYFNVVAFNKVAELVGNTLHKGVKIIIQGTMDVRQYEKRTEPKVHGQKLSCESLNTVRKKKQQGNLFK